MKCFLVSHTHWDREWYRTFERFRARLVDTVDRVLELIAADPDYHFLLDGQTIVLEDYLAVRPERLPDLQAACRSGRMTIGPWYVQPDSLLPSGEAHVRNLLEGRRVGAEIGPVSSVAYTPDSFGHPAQFPQLFRGFGLGPFVYWRGNGDEIDELPSEYVWVAPDGSAVLAHFLAEAYFAAAGLPRDPEAAARDLERLGRQLEKRTRSDSVLLMNGIDHALPDAHTADVTAALAARTGWTVRRGRLEDFAAELRPDAPRFAGELLGGRFANLLPGVWSTRTPLKLRNRATETRLQAWAEPWTALGRALGTPDERPSLRLAWRALLQNQAHDSICGCSQDRVHEQMAARYDAAEELAAETTARTLERIAGLGSERRVAWSDEIDVAVFNPSPHPRSDVVCFALDPSQWLATHDGESRGLAIHPLLFAGLRVAGFTVDGRPTRLVADDSTRRIRLIPDSPPRSVEFVAEDLPAFGWRRFRLRPSAEAHPEQEDDGRTIAVGDRSIEVATDGTLNVRFGDRAFAGLAAIEDTGDRGDTYDFDPVPPGEWSLDDVRVRRASHANGVARLTVRRVLSIPEGLAPERDRRAAESVQVVLETEVRLVPGTDRVDLRVRLDNRARDHRLRFLFPTGAPVEEFLAETTFDVARRRTARREAKGWLHPAPSTFPHQGCVSANGLTIAAPGLYEAEVTPEGVIAMTLVRAVGWLSRMDLASRPQMAGPSMPTPGAQCIEVIEADLSLHCGFDWHAVRDAENRPLAVFAGEQPLFPPDLPLVELHPRQIVLSALKPAQNGPGFVLRLLNPTDAALDARVEFGIPIERAVPVRLDETPDGDALSVGGGGFALNVPAHALRSVAITPASR